MRRAIECRGRSGLFNMIAEPFAELSLKAHWIGGDVSDHSTALLISQPGLC